MTSDNANRSYSNDRFARFDSGYWKDEESNRIIAYTQEHNHKSSFKEIFEGYVDYKLSMSFN